MPFQSRREVTPSPVASFANGLLTPILQRQQAAREQAYKLQQIREEATARQDALNSDPMTQVYRLMMLKQLQDAGLVPKQPTGAVPPGSSTPPSEGTGSPAPSTLGAYLRDQAQKRQTGMAPQLQPSLSMGKGGVTTSLKPLTLKPIPEKEQDAVVGLDNSIQALEGLLTRGEKFKTRFDPTNILMKNNPISNYLRQHDDPDLDAFLKDYQNAELEYRKNLEGLRFIQGGQSIAQAAYPNPRNQKWDQFRQSALNSIARMTQARENHLQRATEAGFDTGRFQSQISPFLDELPANQFVTGLSKPPTSSTDMDAVKNRLRGKYGR